MKKLLAAAVCSVMALVVWAGQTSAGIFGGCCNKCGVFCVRPYNAFSPVCYGTVTCAGVNPLCSPGYGPNLAFHGVGPQGQYGVGVYPVMSPPMDPHGMHQPMITPSTPQTPETLPAPKSEDKKSEGDATPPDTKSARMPAVNPYGMTPWGVPVWAMSNPYANPYAPRMPMPMPYGQMPPQMPYGQMPPQMPYPQMPQAMPNYNWNGYMPNMMNPGMGMPGMGMPGSMPPMMPNAR